jgi:hypothetical protein
MTTRGFGDVPEEAALSRQGSKRTVNNTDERWLTWILRSAVKIRDFNPNKYAADSRFFPTVCGSNVFRKSNRRVINEYVYLRTIANERIRKCRNGRKLGEVNKSELSVFETGGLDGLMRVQKRRNFNRVLLTYRRLQPGPSPDYGMRERASLGSSTRNALRPRSPIQH